MSSSNQRSANRGCCSVLRCAISNYRQLSCLSAPEPDSAVAVQTKGLGVGVVMLDESSMLRTRALTLEKEPRRMAFWVMMQNQRST